MFMMKQISSLYLLTVHRHSASLRHVCPEGVYVSITPGDPTRWIGALFVRKGIYNPTTALAQLVLWSYLSTQLISAR